MKSFLGSIQKQFHYYKLLGEKTIEQIPEKKLFWQAHEQCNSVAIIVQHLSGNMLSRLTDFLTTDGEKEWRQRDNEFKTVLNDKSAVIEEWNKGWECLFLALKQLSENDLDKGIYIRNMEHSVGEAIHRQLAHYSYHVGQLVFLGKLICGKQWKSLSIPIGKSEEYNQSKFKKPKGKSHFTDDL